MNSYIPTSLAALLAKIDPNPKNIYGCDTESDPNKPRNVYMVRYHIYANRLFKCYVHVFNRSDDERALHDHPWHFVSVILYRGYKEHTPAGVKRAWPGMILFRPANWIHRVELLKDKEGKLLPAVTMVFVTRKVRMWGFHTSHGWLSWLQYAKKFNCDMEVNGNYEREETTTS